MAACTHGMPTPASCVECMEDGNLPLPARPVEIVTLTFYAYYDGHCATCNLPTSAGERISRLSTGRYVHERCAP